MLEPLPTPYDILPIPYFAYAPGYLEWLMVLTAALLLLAAVVIFYRRNVASNSQSLPNFFQIAESAFQQAMQECSANPQQGCPWAKVILVAKRFLSVAEQVDFSSMTPAELKEFIESCDKRELCLVLNLIHSLDLQKYQKGTPGNQYDKLRELLNGLRDYHKSSSGGAD